MSASPIDSIRAFQCRHGVPEPNAGLIVAVSGGADSMALLTALHELADTQLWNLVVAHVDHGLRPESASDATFVEEYAHRLGLRFESTHANVAEKAQSTGLSIEMAARDARYLFFAEVANKHNCRYVVTAHTADDQAETVLLRVIRGCGLAGLGGIRPVTERDACTLLRPLLGVTRRSIETYLLDREIEWRTDTSNADMQYQRNWIRHELLPMIAAELNPGIRNSLCRLAATAAGDNDFLNTVVERVLAESSHDDGSIDTQALLQSSPTVQQRVLVRWLFNHGVDGARVTHDRIESIIGLCVSDAGSASLDIGDDISVQRQYDSLTIINTDAPPPEFCVDIAIPGTTPIPGTDLVVEAEVSPGLTRDNATAIGHYPARATLNINPSSTLVVRSWRDGDRMHPQGLDGSKKLQDIFVDARVPASGRQRIPIFEVDGGIVWIPGYRVATSALVDNETEPHLQLCVRA